MFSFIFSFPFKRPEILNLWIKAVNRDKWYPSKTSRICSDHFLSSDYKDLPGSTLKILKHDAVPSVFCFSKHTKQRRKLLRNVSLNTSYLSVEYFVTLCIFLR